MKILLAGASGALGRQLIPRLVSAGHDVAGITRSQAKSEQIVADGATPVLADALDAEAIARVVAETQPEAIIHQLTAFGGRMDESNIERRMGPTNRLRIEATDNLLAAGRAVGVRRFIAQSYAGNGFPFPRTGGRIKHEDDPIDDAPADGTGQAIEAIRHLESAVTGATWTVGVVLRYGTFYGPGTAFGRDGEYAEQIRRRRIPIIGGGGGVWSFVHIEDAADATVAALTRGQRGIYHIVDDEPAPVAAWLPAAAAVLGAKRPHRVPRWVGRLLAGQAVTSMMTEARGAANEKAKRELEWRPAHPSWRTGFEKTLT